MGTEEDVIKNLITELGQLTEVEASVALSFELAGISNITILKDLLKSRESIDTQEGS